MASASFQRLFAASSAALLLAAMACQPATTAPSHFAPASDAGEVSGPTGEAVSLDGGDPTASEPPLARINAPATVNAGDEIALDGTASTTTRDGALSFSWRVTAGAGGHFSLRDTKKPTAIARFLTRGNYRVSLVVSANGVDSAPAEVRIAVDDTTVRPVANAGADQEATVGTLVALSGSGSRDPNGDALSYTWTILEGGDLPGFDEHAERPKFSAALPHATYRFSLVVNDGLHASDPVEVAVRVKNSAPVLSGVVDHAVHLKTVPLTVSATDPDGDSLTYAWEFVEKPHGSAATIAEPTARETSFVADVIGPYKLRVTVRDGASESSAEMSVTPTNTAPAIDNGAAVPTQPSHRCATNRCTATTKLAVDVVDADDADLAVAFTMEAAPNGSATARFCATPTTAPSAERPGWTNVACDVTIETVGATANAPAPAIAGNYTFEAKVTDSFGDSRTLTIALTVQNEAPVLNVQGPATVNYAARRDAQNAALWTLMATTAFEGTATDLEGGLKSIAWRTVDVPAGVTVLLGARAGTTQPVTISAASQDVATLRRFVSNGYTLEFQAEDLNGLTATRRVSFAIVDRPVVWDGVDGATTSGHTTAVTGSERRVATSYDLTAKVRDDDKRIAEYQWNSLGRRIATTTAPSARIDFVWTLGQNDVVPVADILGRRLTVNAVDFKGDAVAYDVPLQTENRAPKVTPYVALLSTAPRSCTSSACAFEAYLTDHAASDDDGDPVSATWEIESPPPGHTFSSVTSGTGPTRLAVTETGRFSFANPPFIGTLMFKLTIRDFLGATATTFVSAPFANLPPRTPVSSIARDNLYGACSTTECIAVFTGDIRLPAPSMFIPPDGDDERVVAWSTLPGQIVEKRSGTYTGCEPKVTCSGLFCWASTTEYVRSRSSASFSNRWVVRYPAGDAAPVELVAAAEDWNLARSASVRIPVSTTISPYWLGCSPIIALTP